MLNLIFQKSVLGLVSPPHFVYEFLRNMFHMLHSINWPNFIVSFLYFSRYWAIYVLQLFVSWHVINFEINLIFLIKSFCYMTKKSRQIPKYLENEIGFWREIKSILHHFYRAFSCQKLFQTWECTFKFSAWR